MWMTVLRWQPYPYALDSEFSLHRKVRSRAQKRDEKKAKEEARREKRKQRRRTDKDGSRSSRDDVEGGSTQKQVAKHRRTKTKGSRSADNFNHRLHDAVVSSMSSDNASIGSSDNGLPYRCPCVLTGPTGEQIRLVANDEGKGSYEIGRKTRPVGIGTHANLQPMLFSRIALVLRFG